MSINDDLIDSIRRTLGNAITPSLSSASAANDLFEAYILMLILQAARNEGANLSYQNVYGARPSQFIFRTSPGYIYSTTHPYTHTIIEFPNKPILEAHVGVMVSGKSGVLHECDVLVLHRTEAEACRQSSVIPRHSKVVLSVECKFYTANIPLGLARSFMGLVSDLSSGSQTCCFFVVNTGSTNVEKLLAHHNKFWEHQISPSFAVDVERLRNAFQNIFKNFKAKN